jgi:uncharacterized damage-inducible protein DinB
MNADAFRHLYAYHFAENRKLWDSYIIPLSDEQFTHQVAYSHGSVRDQVVHLMSVDAAWFSGLRGDPPPPEFAHDDVAARPIIRARWDGVEQRMRAYLADLRDEMLFARPFSEGEDKELVLWQVLLHVVNHGTDHRAQLLRVLNDLGVETMWQDYIFYAYDNP